MITIIKVMSTFKRRVLLGISAVCVGAAFALFLSALFGLAILCGYNLINTGNASVITLMMIFALGFALAGYLVYDYVQRVAAKEAAFRRRVARLRDYRGGANVDRCAACGETVPEGRMVCGGCERDGEAK